MDMKVALVAPGKHFESPQQLATHADLTREQKCTALHQWAYDLRELQVATDENMAPEADSGDNGELLRQVEDLLADLDPNGEISAPTRQG